MSNEHYQLLKFFPIYLIFSHKRIDVNEESAFKCVHWPNKSLRVILYVTKSALRLKMAFKHQIIITFNLWWCHKWLIKTPIVIEYLCAFST